MNYFSRAPLIRLIVPFLAGIVSFVYLQSPVKNLTFFLVFLFSILVIYLFTFSGKYNYRYIWGILSFLLLFLSGYQLTANKTESFNEHHFSKFSSQNSLALARVIEPIIEKEKTFKTTLEIIRVKEEGNWNETTGKAVAYFQRDTTCYNLELNDLIIVNAVFNDVSPPTNPGEFNYKNYLSNHFIYQQTFLTTDNWLILSKEQEFSLIKIANDTRNKLLNVFTKYGIENNEFAVVSALMLGYKDKLDPEVVRAYSGAGAMHVLAVSGLHVGIVFFIFNFMLFFLDKIPYGYLIKAILLLIALWAYAILTGLSPSVMRAATMFTFIIIGKAFTRNTNIYNTLAASAFILLLYNPYLIMEVGFQLSYLAVIGIVCLQPKIYNLFTPNNWLLNQIWALTAVSLSAQIATFPLGLLYFHQFPNYFIISNIFVIPAATLVIYSGMVLLALSGIEFIAELIAKFLNGLVKLLNEAVAIIERLPFAITDGIHFTILQTWLIYAFIISAIAFFVLKKSKYLFLTLSVFIVFLIAGLPVKLNKSNQKKMIVYNIKGHSAINFINDNNNIIFTDLSQINDKSKIQFHMRNNWILLGTKNEQFINPDTVKNGITIMNSGLFAKENFFKFYKTNIGWINNHTELSEFSSCKIKLDYIIISDNPKIKIRDILNRFEVKVLIIDSSNSVYKARQFTEQCTELGVDYHAVFKSGAFIADLAL